MDKAIDSAGIHLSLSWWSVISVSFIHWTAVCICMCVQPLLWSMLLLMPMWTLSLWNRLSRHLSNMFSTPKIIKITWNIKVFQVSCLSHLLVSMVCIIPTSLFMVLKCQWGPGPPQLKHPKGYKDVNTANHSLMAIPYVPNPSWSGLSVPSTQAWPSGVSK